MGFNCSPIKMSRYYEPETFPPTTPNPSLGQKSREVIHTCMFSSGGVLRFPEGRDADWVADFFDDLRKKHGYVRIIDLLVLDNRFLVFIFAVPRKEG